MKYYEVTVTVCLMKDMHFSEAGEAIGRLINASMLFDEELSARHVINEFKLYCFNSLYPLEQDKIYKEGRMYVFNIRGLEEDCIYRLTRTFIKVKSSIFKIVSCEVRDRKIRKVNTLYTITPVIITVGGKPWLPGGDVEFLKERLQANLEKKYRSYTEKTIECQEGFIDDIRILSKKPIAYTYKGKRILGSKIELKVSNNEGAIKLAFIAEATGLGEKNSALGAGFCKAKYLAD